MTLPMENKRLATLLGFLEANPNDSFARYGVAQEYVKAGEHENGLTQFTTLIELSPDYQAAYYHAGKVCEALGRPPQARGFYERGIEASRRTGDLHARSELETALSELGD